MTTTFDAEQERVISKIQALLRQAAHPNTGQAERETFQAKAFALMEKHRLQNITIDADQAVDPEETLYGVVKGSYALPIHNLIDTIARMYNCRTYYSSSGRAGDPTRTVWMIGFPDDTHRVKLLAAMFIDDAKQQAARHKTDDPNRTIKFRKSFMFGYADEIQRRYAEAMKDQEVQEAAASTALVLVSREERVQEAYDNLTLRKASRSKQTISAAGYNAGVDAAANSNIGRGRIGNSARGALGR